jgi:hypothetical protein
MRRTLLASGGVLAVALSVVWLAACDRPAPAGSDQAAGKAAAGKAARTAWGDPDLQGTWDSLTTTPFERAKQYGTREFMTEQEAADRAKNNRSLNTSGTETAALPEGEAEDVTTNLSKADEARNASADAVPEDTPGRRIVGAEYNAFWNAPVRARKQSLRTSQIVDPPDGRLPAYTREALEMWDAREKARLGRGQGDSWEDRGLGERCIAQPVGNGVFAGGNKSIMQAPGYVVIHWFTPGDGVFRVVPLDGRPHVGAGITQWYGDSRGRWEGDTLVVETTNFNNEQAGEILPAHGALFGTGHSHNYAGTGETLKLTERFTRTNADTIEYRATIEDPKVFVRPWTTVNEWTLDDKKRPEYEYACHEHNYGMVNALAGARANERDSLAEAERELKLRKAGMQQKWDQLKAWEATGNQAGTQTQKGSSR